MAGGYHYSILQVGELDVQEPHRFSVLPAACRQARCSWKSEIPVCIDKPAAGHLPLHAPDSYLLVGSEEV